MTWSNWVAITRRYQDTDDALAQRSAVRAASLTCITRISSPTWKALPKRIVAHCGLAWDARCLDFDRTERIVRTASAVQVRQPLYKSSVGRWRKYEAFLGSLLAEIEPSVMTASTGPAHKADIPSKERLLSLSR